MGFAKRIFLFMAVNVLILVTLSATLQLLGVRPYLTAYGLDYKALASFCLIWGMGGAFISLGLSRIMAKMMCGVRVIDPRADDQELGGLVRAVHRLAQAAGLGTMPQVGIYDSPEINAFATGPTRNRALVAVSTGLLARMGREELEAVLGHEVSHIANGDMVTMTLLQGVVNAFVMFFARVIAFAVCQNVREENRPMVRMLTTFVLEIALSLLGFLVVARFSRRREFRADRGGAGLAGARNMIGALRTLQRAVSSVGIDAGRPALATLKISGKPLGLLALMATHPPFEVRIAALERLA